MTTIIAYGSLINKEQLHHSTDLFYEARPVIVKGYRRVFNQEPSWRTGQGSHRAVLNVVKSEQDTFNGLLIDLRDGSDLRELDEREKGYNRIIVKKSCLIGYQDAAVPGGADPVYLYTGKPEKRSDKILPNEQYLALCLSGARQWGDRFYKQFIQTTYVGKITLSRFLHNRN